MAIDPEHTEKPSCIAAPKSADDADLDAYLRAIEGDERFVVRSVLKRSPFETTEVVDRIEDGGSMSGPYVRKRLSRDSGLGSAYRTLYEAARTSAPHTFVPRVYECYDTEDSRVVVMEYVHGSTLREVVERKGPSFALACEVYPAVCRAVMGLHRSFDPPLIHRDLKPDNIIMRNGGAVLVDLGIARQWQEGKLRDTMRFGTREFAPPEQYGFGQTDVRSDVYALGQLLFYCLTGRTATQRDRDASFLVEGVTERTAPIVKRAMAFAPAERYESVDALLRAFGKATRQVAFPHPALPSPKSERAASHSLDSFPRRLSAFIPDGVGRVWNVIVIAAWALFMAVDIDMLRTDAASLAPSWPAWYSAMVFGGWLGLAFTVAAYLLLDKRRLRARFAWLRSWSLLQEVLVLIAALLVYFGAVVIVGAMFVA